MLALKRVIAIIFLILGHSSLVAQADLTSGSGEVQENAGIYKLKDAEARLDMDSDAGPGDDSSWHLTLRNDTLFMRGIGTERQENSEVILVR